MKLHKQIHKASVPYLLAGGSMLAVVGLLINPQPLLNNTAPTKNICQEIVQPKAVLSREGLSRLLTIPERSNKKKVRDFLKEPYCTLPPVEVRSGVKAVREVYPLSFDPTTQVVLLFEGEEYAGYDFSFSR